MLPDLNKMMMMIMMRQFADKMARSQQRR